MSNPAEQFAAAQQANLEAFEGAISKAFAGAEKLVELNLAASKAALGESFNHAKAVLAVKTPQEFMSLQTAFFQPMAEKSTAYFQHVQSIATEGSADFTKATGIKLNRVDADDAGIEARLKAEGSASAADVILLVDASRLWRGEVDGLFQPVKSKLLEDAIPAQLRGKTANDGGTPWCIGLGSGGATGAILRELKRAGYPPAARGQRFRVTGMFGPLKTGELERARAWGTQLARTT